MAGSGFLFVAKLGMAYYYYYPEVGKRMRGKVVEEDEISNGVQHLICRIPHCKKKRGVSPRESGK